MKVRKAIKTRSCTIAGKNIRSLIYLGLYLIIAACLVAQGIFHESSIWVHLSLAGVIALVITIGILIHYRVLNRTLIEPLITLKEAADEMLDKLEGDEPFVADIHTGDEIEELAHSIEALDRNLKHYIRENTAITAMVPGSSLFVYTDGLPEANNSQAKLFGPDRMLAALNKNPELEPEAALKAV